MRAFKSIFRRSAWLAASLFATSCATLSGGAADGAAAAKGAVSAPHEPVFLQADVLGLDASSLDGLLGPAALVRREGSGEFRRYAFARCELIVILYPDESGEAAVRQLDAAAKKSGEEKPDLDLCLAGGPAAPLS